MRTGWESFGSQVVRRCNRRLLQRAQVGGEFARLGIVPLAQFRRQLEQPGQSIRPLEAGPAFAIRRYCGLLLDMRGR